VLTSSNWQKELSPEIKKSFDKYVNELYSQKPTNELYLSDFIKVTASKNQSSDRYDINISIGREVIVNGRFDDAMNIIKNDIELRIAELQYHPIPISD